MEEMKKCMNTLKGQMQDLTTTATPEDIFKSIRRTIIDMAIISINHFSGEILSESFCVIHALCSWLDLIEKYSKEG